MRGFPNIVETVDKGLGERNWSAEEAEGEVKRRHEHSVGGGFVGREALNQGGQRAASYLALLVEDQFVGICSLQEPALDLLVLCGRVASCHTQVRQGGLTSWLLANIRRRRASRALGREARLGVAAEVGATGAGAQRSHSLRAERAEQLGLLHCRRLCGAVALAGQRCRRDLRKRG
jgi:hypothetical protein